MFTGIVQGVARVANLRDQQGIRTLTLRFPAGALTDLAVGASVAVAGVCLTATRVQGDTAWFDVIDETLRKTTLGHKQVGDLLNYERSLRMGAEIGGHLLSGHISGQATLVALHTPPGNWEGRFRVDPALMDYVFPKGFVSLDGCSLTVGQVGPTTQAFAIHLIPETLRVTTLGSLSVGEQVNLELDAITLAAVDTVRRVLERQAWHTS